MSEVTLSATSRVKGYDCYRCSGDLKAGDTIHSFHWDGDLIAHHEDCCSPYCPDRARSPQQGPLPDVDDKRVVLGVRP